MPQDTNERLDELEAHVMSQERSNPGLLMRVDRLELFVKLLIFLASIGVAWKALDVLGTVMARVATP